MVASIVRTVPPGFAPSARVTTPLPVPELLPEIVINDVCELATHAHPDPEVFVMVTVTVPPFAGTLAWSGETVKAQVPADAPDWAIVTVRPATLAVPTRAAPALASTASTATPASVPDAPDLTLMNGEALVVVHPQFDPTAAVTVTATSTAEAPTDASAGEIVSSHGKDEGAPAACVTVSVRLATVTLPCRPSAAFGCTVKRTDPLPVPPAAPVTLMKGAADAAVQLQAFPLAVTGIVNSAPLAAIAPAGASPVVNVQLDDVEDEP